MGIAISLRAFLDSNHLAYETVAHKHTRSSLGTAAAAHVPGEIPSPEG